MSKLWICEKPSQAKLVAARIGSAKSNKGFIDTRDGKVTWCVGHLIGFKKPGDLDEKWKAWNIESLPIIPERFDYESLKGKEDQLKIVGQLLKETNHVVLATDGDREGELLGREVLDFYNWKGKLERMWNTNLDDESIDSALKKIQPGKNTDDLYLAAQARAEVDYISGMTLTRAATKCFGNGSEILSVGRVQTAVLGLIVRRDLAIKNFIPTDFYELKGYLSKSGESYNLNYAPGEENRILNESIARELRDKLTGCSAPLSVERKRKRRGPPKLFNLKTLQQIANKAFKWSASKTKEVTQSLYDAQLVSYPRTDSEYLPNEQENDAPKILCNLGKIQGLSKAVDSLGKDLIYRDTIFNTAKTTAHHAIVPTKKLADLSKLTSDEKALYEIIAARYVAAFLPDYEYDSTVIKLKIGEYEFKGSGSVPAVEGWKIIYPGEAKTDEENQKFPDLENGESGKLDKIEVVTKTTKAPPRYTPASILEDMEDISKYTEDKSILQQIKIRIKEGVNAGIGSPSTRDTYTDILTNRNFIEIKANKIYSTEPGRKLVEVLPDQISDPIETVVMEGMLDQIADKNLNKDEFIRFAIQQTKENLKSIIESKGKFVKNEIAFPCPDCGKAMIRRKGAHGFFWSCSGYPDCKVSMNDSRGKPVPKAKISTLVNCTCGKPLAKREGKSKGKKYLFWGCTGYPDCKKTYKDKNGVPDI